MGASATAIPSLLVDPTKYPLRSNYTEQLIKTFWLTASPSFREDRERRLRGGKRSEEGKTRSGLKVHEKVADTTRQTPVPSLHQVKEATEWFDGVLLAS